MSGTRDARFDNRDVPAVTSQAHSAADDLPADDGVALDGGIALDDGLVLDEGVAWDEGVTADAPPEAPAVGGRAS